MKDIPYKEDKTMAAQSKFETPLWTITGLCRTTLKFHGNTRPTLIWKPAQLSRLSSISLNVYEVHDCAYLVVAATDELTHDKVNRDLDTHYVSASEAFLEVV